MATSGLQELIDSVRAVLMQDAAISKAGVFYSRAPQEDDLPYVLFSLTPMPLSRRFGGESVRLYRVMVKACAADVGNKGANEIAGPLAESALELLAGDGAADLLNEQLADLGWNALIPLEAMPLEPYSDRVAEIERWFFGGVYDIRIQAIGD